MIYDIYTSATGDRRRFYDNCSTCILSLLTDCGRIYFQDITEDALKKVSIKTEKRGKVKRTTKTITEK